MHSPSPPWPSAVQQIESLFRKLSQKEEIDAIHKLYKKKLKEKDKKIAEKEKKISDLKRYIKNKCQKN